MSTLHIRTVSQPAVARQERRETKTEASQALKGLITTDLVSRRVPTFNKEVHRVMVNRA